MRILFAILLFLLVILAVIGAFFSTLILFAIKDDMDMDREIRENDNKTSE